MFSGLNNLTDITLDPCYSAICGYTETDLDTVFAPELPGLDRERIRDWYNGYNWLGTTRSITRSTFCCCSGDSRSGVTRTSTARPVNPST